MNQRWWLLGALLVVALAAGFGIGSAVKSSSAPAQTGSLAAGGATTGEQATVTGPQPGAAVPPLKAKASRTQTTTSSSTSTSTSAASSTAATTTAVVTQTTTTPVVSTPVTHTTVNHTTTGGGGGGGGGGG